MVIFNSYENWNGSKYGIPILKTLIQFRKTLRLYPVHHFWFYGGTRLYNNEMIPHLLHLDLLGNI